MSITFILILASSVALADGMQSGDDAALHVDDQYQSCFIDLHRELSPSQLRKFTGEFGAAIDLSGMTPHTIGRGHVSLGLVYQAAYLNDRSDRWNNAWSHPNDTHWLGNARFPVPKLRVGVSERVDVEAFGSGDPTSNWGFVGVAAQVMILDQPEQSPISLSGRASAIHLLGARELDIETLSVEVLASARLRVLTPYVGVGQQTAVALERSDDVDLKPALGFSTRAKVGTELALGKFRMTAEGALAQVPSWAVMVGATL